MVTPATERKRAKEKARLAALGITLIEKPSSGYAKFNNVWALYKGEKYQSAGEAEHAWRLDMLALAKKITDWERPKAIAVEACIQCLAGPREPCKNAKGLPIETLHRDRLKYKPDFYVVAAEPTDMMTLKPMATGYYIDYKGGEITETEPWRIRVRLWKLHVPFELRVAYRDGTEKVVCTGNDAIQERLKNG